MLRQTGTKWAPVGSALWWRTCGSNVRHSSGRGTSLSFTPGLLSRGLTTNGRRFVDASSSLRRQPGLGRLSSTGSRKHSLLQQHPTTKPSFKGRSYHSTRPFRTDITEETLAQPPPSTENMVWVQNTFYKGRVIDILRFVFPRLEQLERRLLMKKFKGVIRRSDSEAASNEALLERKLQELNVIFRPKEGGCFLCFSNKQEAQHFQKYLPNHFLTFFPPRSRSFFVEGKPFFEDITAIQPSIKLAVECEGGAVLGLETIYRVLRKYGKLTDLKPVDEKKGQYVAYYLTQSGAISARQCIHGKKLMTSDGKDVILSARYQPYKRFQDVRTRFLDPRFLIPVTALAVTLSTYLLVTPIRIFSVTQKISLPTLYFRSQYDDESLELKGVFHMEEKEKQQADLETNILNKLPSSLILLTGPKGTGKSSITKQLALHRTFAVYIDCRGKTVQEFIDRFSAAIGFSPSFTVVNKFFSWVETILPSKAGSVMGVSETLQMEDVLRTLHKALGFIAASYPSDKNKEYSRYSVLIFDGLDQLLDAIDKGDSSKSQVLLDSLLDWAIDVTYNRHYAHVVFVSDNPMVEERLKKNHEHLGGQMLRFVVSDMPLEDSVEYLNKRSKRIADANPKDVEKAATLLGGRLCDLRGLVNRVERGYTVNDAVQDMIEDTKRYLRSEQFDNSVSASKKPWTNLQFWKAINTIVEAEGDQTNKKQITYDQLLFEVFEGKEEPLRALIHEHILGISPHSPAFGTALLSGTLPSSSSSPASASSSTPNSREVGKHKESTSTRWREKPTYIIAGSEKLLQAFKLLIQDEELSRKMAIAIKQAQIAEFAATVKSAEEELVKLAKVYEATPPPSGVLPFKSAGADGVQERITVLKAKLLSATKELRKLEPELKVLQGK